MTPSVVDVALAGSGELFAGVGGLGMAVDAVFGTTPRWVAEHEPPTKADPAPWQAPSRVLAHRHPGVPNLGDVAKIVWDSTRHRVRVLSGGFPCQDVSLGGRRSGLHDGTRSGLWSEFARAIDELRPDWVVIENVRGLLSATATSDVEPCPWCVGDDADQHALRALGAVFGDLANLGFDAEWTLIPAADAGAPHRRERVFILAWPAENTTSRRGRRGPATPRRGSGTGSDPAADGSDPGTDGAPAAPGVKLLPTPVTTDAKGAMNAGSNRQDDSQHHSGVTLTDAMRALFPTPKASDGAKGGPNQRGSSGDLTMSSAVQALLPTPSASVANDGEGPDTWLARREVVKESAQNGNGMGMPLTIAVQLLPTPTSTNHRGNDVNNRGEALLPGVAASLLPTPIATEGKGTRAGDGREGGPSLTDAVVGRVGALLPTPGAYDGERGGARPVDERKEGGHSVNLQDVIVHGLPLLPTPTVALAEGGQTSRSGDRKEELLLGGIAEDVASKTRLLSTPDTAPDAPNSGSNSHKAGNVIGLGNQVTSLGTDWGEYTQAIRTWEAVTGRPAPAPVRFDGKGGKPRLNPELTEWMMGWPAGWVTDPALWVGCGKSASAIRSAQLKACGNGVVPQQAALALLELLGRPGVPDLEVTS